MHYFPFLMQNRINYFKNKTRKLINVDKKHAVPFICFIIFRSDNRVISETQTVRLRDRISDNYTPPNTFEAIAFI